jgi:hypothetical protein
VIDVGADGITVMAPGEMSVTVTVDADEGAPVEADESAPVEVPPVAAAPAVVVAAPAADPAPPESAPPAAVPSPDVTEPVPVTAGPSPAEAEPAPRPRTSHLPPDESNDDAGVAPRVHAPRNETERTAGAPVVPEATSSSLVSESATTPARAAARSRHAQRRTGTQPRSRARQSRELERIDIAPSPLVPSDGTAGGQAAAVTPAATAALLATLILMTLTSLTLRAERTERRLRSLLWSPHIDPPG